MVRLTFCYSKALEHVQLHPEETQRNRAKDVPVSGSNGEPSRHIRDPLRPSVAC